MLPVFLWILTCPPDRRKILMPRRRAAALPRISKGQPFRVYQCLILH